MIRLFFKKQKPLPLGRWQTNVEKAIMERKADLANCDSCGTCDVPKKHYNTKDDSLIMVEDDIIDLGLLVNIGSFHVNIKN